MDKLKQYREKIDDIDSRIVKLLILRFKAVERISGYKKANKIKVIDRSRESQVIKGIKKKSAGKNQKSVVGIYKKIINYSRKLQSE